MSVEAVCRVWCDQEVSESLFVDTLRRDEDIPSGVQRPMRSPEEEPRLWWCDIADIPLLSDNLSYFCISLIPAALSAC